MRVFGRVLSEGAVFGCAMSASGADYQQIDREPSTLKRKLFASGQNGELTDSEWKAARASDYNAWIIPSALLMTVGFSLLMVLQTDDAAPPDHLLQWLTGGAYAGSPTEELLRATIAHLYLFAMATSGMAGLRCVNDFSAALLLNANTPAHLLQGMHAVRASDAWRADLPANLFPHLAAKKVLACSTGRPGKFSSWLSGLLFGGVNNEAYFSAVHRLAVGIVLGVFHKYGSSHALVVLLPCVLYPLELQYRTWERYEGPHKAFLAAQKLPQQPMA